MMNQCLQIGRGGSWEVVPTCKLDLKDKIENGKQNNQMDGQTHRKIRVKLSGIKWLPHSYFLCSNCRSFFGETGGWDLLALFLSLLSE